MFMSDQKKGHIKDHKSFFIMVACGAALVLGATAWGAYLYQEARQKQEEQPQSETLDYSEAATQMNNQAMETASLDELLVNYEQYYDASAHEVRTSNPAAWDQEMLDKAFLCFIYADRTEMYTAAEDMALAIERARHAEVDITKNSAGMTEAQFDARKQFVIQKVDEKIKARSGAE